MKLLVLANTDQLGKSGVGDFAILLSQELRRRGIDSTLAAIHPNPTEREWQLTNLMRAIKPDWVSLHFVPYAYAQRGLVGKRTLPWSKIRGRVGSHIYFHEIWIGAHHGAGWRHRLAGSLQRKGIHRMLREYQPSVVHCSNSLASALLKREGIANGKLPLFGAIPVASGSHDPYNNLFQALAPGTGRCDWVVAALFGNIYQTPSFLSTIQWLNVRTLGQGKKLLVVSLGHAPTAQTEFSGLFAQFSQGRPPYFYVVGRIDADKLSSWIKGADCCLATTPFNIIEKSSSAVAFVEHGVPVIVMDKGSPVRGISYAQSDLAPEFWLFGDPRLEAYACLPPRRAPNPRLEHVTQQFIDDLQLQSP